jgi:hypothetical protein
MMTKNQFKNLCVFYAMIHGYREVEEGYSHKEAIYQH